MEQALPQLQDKLVPVEELFFTWLIRIIAAAILVGSAWIDDAPPLSLAAIAVAAYVGIRLIMQFKVFVSIAPFKHKMPRVIFAVGLLILLGLSFATVTIFVERIAIFVVS